MELAHLKALIAIAKEGNLTRAAKKLYLTQPALSAQILGLEKELGMKLFYRGSKGMKLSNSGKQLLKRADSILKEVEYFLLSAKEIKGELSGDISFSHNMESSVLHLSRLISQISAEAPKLKLSFYKIASADVFKKLDLKEIDLGFVLGNYQAPLDIEVMDLKILSRKIIAPLSLKEQLMHIKESDLKNYSWIFSESYFSPNSKLAHFIEKNQLSSSYYADNEGVIIDFVSNKKGLSFLLSEQVQHKKDQIFILEPYDFPIPLKLFYRKELKDDPVCDFVIKKVMDFWEKQVE